MDLERALNDVAKQLAASRAPRPRTWLVPYTGPWPRPKIRAPHCALVDVPIPRSYLPPAAKREIDAHRRAGGWAVIRWVIPRVARPVAPVPPVRPASTMPSRGTFVTGRIREPVAGTGPLDGLYGPRARRPSFRPLRHVHGIPRRVSSTRRL